MLRAKRTSVKTDSDEDESNFAILDSVCPPAELATDHINSDFANRYTQLDHREEEDGQDTIDEQMKELFSSIHFKSQKIKMQLNSQGTKPLIEIQLKEELEVDISRCDEDDLVSLNESVVTVQHQKADLDEEEPA